MTRAPSRASCQLRGARGPECVGIRMNKVNRTFKSYRRHHAELVDVARANGMRVLANQLSPASALMTATDGTLDFATVREKHETYDDHVRKATTEVLRVIQEAP
ncbi:MAG: hypothetical protein V2J24_01695 [Pseudomonadales bacterium]|jgi:hypothetical protein|nr:hypothetical protein [Pseudomonadales bacterium]